MRMISMSLFWELTYGDSNVLNLKGNKSHLSVPIPKTKIRPRIDDDVVYVRQNKFPQAFWKRLHSALEKRRGHDQSHVNCSCPLCCGTIAVFHLYSCAIVCWKKLFTRSRLEKTEEPPRADRISSCFGKGCASSFVELAGMLPFDKRAKSLRIQK